MPTPSTDAIGKSANAAVQSPIRGILLMFTSTFFFAAMHAVIRYLTETLHPFEVAFFRNFFGLIFVLPWFIRFGAFGEVLPDPDNRVSLHPTRTDRWGLPLALLAGAGSANVEPQ